MKRMKVLLSTLLGITCLFLVVSCAPGASAGGGSTGGSTGGSGGTDGGLSKPDVTGLIYCENDSSQFILKNGKYTTLYYRKINNADEYKIYELTVDGTKPDSAATEKGVFARLEYNGGDEVYYSEWQRDMDFRNKWLKDYINYDDDPEHFTFCVETSNPKVVGTDNWTYESFINFLKSNKYFNSVYRNADNTHYILRNSGNKCVEITFVE